MYFYCIAFTLNNHFHFISGWWRLKDITIELFADIIGLKSYLTSVQDTVSFIGSLASFDMSFDYWDADYIDYDKGKDYVRPKEVSGKKRTYINHVIFIHEKMFTSFKVMLSESYSCPGPHPSITYKSDYGETYILVTPEKSSSNENEATATIKCDGFSTKTPTIITTKSPTISPTRSPTKNNPTSEIILFPNNLIDTISNPPNEFILTFELYPNDIISNYGSILRYTGSSNNCCNWPDRWLLLKFHANSYKMHFVVGSTLNGNNYIDKDGVEGNIWNKIKVTAIDDKVSLYINDNFVGELPNTNRPDLPEVKVYAGDSFHQSANGKLRNLSFVPVNPPTSVSQPPVSTPTESPKCKSCSNMPWKKGKNCESDLNKKKAKKNCKNKKKWRKKLFCEKRCFEFGQGYEQSNCC